jgi:hypothetical protein
MSRYVPSMDIFDCWSFYWPCIGMGAERHLLAEHTVWYLLDVVFCISFSRGLDLGTPKMKEIDWACMGYRTWYAWKRMNRLKDLLLAYWEGWLFGSHGIPARSTSAMGDGELWHGSERTQKVNASRISAGCTVVGEGRHTTDDEGWTR